ncbi:hypothetical protein [Streptomyces sp. YGL11-2]|uniref:hypothetical protein n=1 Tax=Streptomyces sp. YGL11-2 TaxID=3414028 RepID=UPI003CFA5D6E
MIKVDDLHIDETGEITASSIDTIAGADLREEIASRLFAYQTMRQDGDRIELARDRGPLKGRRMVTYTKIG